MEVDAETKEAEVRAFRPLPVPPRAQPRVKGGNGKGLSMQDGKRNEKGEKIPQDVPSSSPALDSQDMAVDNNPDVVVLAQKIQLRPLVSLKETLREAKAKRLAEMKALLRE